jgi:hypothetical protein
VTLAPDILERRFSVRHAPILTTGLN